MTSYFLHSILNGTLMIEARWTSLLLMLIAAVSMLAADLPACEQVPNARKSSGVNESAALRESARNIRLILIAMHDYYKAHGSFPPVANLDDDGRMLLSWRVHLLPFLNENELYEAFHLDEPWDSPHNKTLTSRMPAIYDAPGRKENKANDGLTTYLVVVGEQAAFRSSARGLNLNEVTDGTSGTAVMFDVNEKHSVVWTRPQDMPFQLKALRPKISQRFHGKILAGILDGAVCALPDDISMQELRALFTIAGDEPTSYDILNSTYIRDLPTSISRDR